MEAKVKVPRAVHDGIMEVRASGDTNMLDRRGVQYCADQLGLYETVVWIEDHKQEYSRGIFHGFEVEEDAQEEVKSDA